MSDPIGLFVIVMCFWVAGFYVVWIDYKLKERLLNRLENILKNVAKDVIEILEAERR